MVFKVNKIYYELIISNIFFLFPFTVIAADFTATITTNSGNPVKNAVITLTSGKSAKQTTGQTYIIDQVNKTYVPHVTVLQSGNHISFPNKDNIRHHVYSFSKAKKFELPLYEGTPAKPVTFNKPGIVVLGCNIHDWMRAYIYVANTPFYGISDNEGKIHIKNIPAGNYALNTWHPRLKEYSASKTTKISMLDKKNYYYQERVDLKPNIKIRRAPKAKRRRY